MMTIMNIVKNRYFLYILGALIIIIGVYFLVNKVHDNIYNSGYQDGISYQKGVYQQDQAKLQQQFDLKQNQVDVERNKLNTQIANLSEQNKELQTKLSKKQTEIKTEVINYAKSNSGSMSCFAPNDNGLLIINKSFPASSN